MEYRCMAGLTASETSSALCCSWPRPLKVRDQHVALPLPEFVAKPCRRPCQGADLVAVKLGFEGRCCCRVSLPRPSSEDENPSRSFGGLPTCCLREVLPCCRNGKLALAAVKECCRSSVYCSPCLPKGGVAAFGTSFVLPLPSHLSLPLIAVARGVRCRLLL